MMETGGDIKQKLKDAARALRNGNNKMYRLFLILLVGICLMVIVWPSDSVETETDGSYGEKATGSSSGDDGSSDSTQGVSESGAGSAAEVSVTDSARYVSYMEDKLETLLSGMDGVSDVSVMITVKDSGESVTVRDVSTDKSESDGESRTSTSEETVMTGGSGASEPYVTSYLEPEIEGVAVCCKGAGNADLSLKITNAVQALFDVPAHKIVVLEAN